MGVSKVIYDGTTLVDLTSDTVTSANLLSGVRATGADGEPVIGTYTAPVGGADWEEDDSTAAGYIANKPPIKSGSGNNSIAENTGTANGYNSHAEGLTTTTDVNGTAAHAEGISTTASQAAAHAEGMYTVASGVGTHAEGNYATASGSYSHAEGDHVTASGNYAHAEGNYTEVSSAGTVAHVEGYNTIAVGAYQHVQGKFNASDAQKAHIVGNGLSTNNRSNAHTLDWGGNAWYAGKVSAGTAASPATPTADNDLTTKAYVDGLVGDVESLLAALR